MSHILKLKNKNKYGGASYKIVNSRTAGTVYMSPKMFNGEPPAELVLDGDGLRDPNAPDPAATAKAEAKKAAAEQKAKEKAEKAAAKAREKEEAKAAKEAEKAAKSKDEKPAKGKTVDAPSI